VIRRNDDREDRVYPVTLTEDVSTSRFSPNGLKRSWSGIGTATHSICPSAWSRRFPRVRPNQAFVYDERVGRSAVPLGMG